jgi:hypothetical protein
MELAAAPFKNARRLNGRGDCMGMFYRAHPRRSKGEVSQKVNKSLSQKLRLLNIGGCWRNLTH